MERAHLTIEELAEATKTVDPDGKGISAATVGRLTSRGKSARERCEEKTAWVVATALHQRTNAPLQDLFDPPFFIPSHSTLRAAEAMNIPLQDLVPMPPHSTSTVERSRSDAAASEA